MENKAERADMEDKKTRRRGKTIQRRRLTRARKTTKTRWRRKIRWRSMRTCQTVSVVVGLCRTRRHKTDQLIIKITKTVGPDLIFPKKSATTVFEAKKLRQKHRNLRH